MSEIVKRHYPASRLPADLREGLDPDATVTVTVAEEQPALPEARSIDEIFAERRPPFRSTKAIVASIRRLRDEWD